MKEQSIWKTYSQIIKEPTDSQPKVDFMDSNSHLLREKLSGNLPPQIAVVIPAYNEELLLPRTLAGLNLALESIPPTLAVSVILVDNDSTDATPEIAKHFGVEVVNEPRKNVGYARQTGLEATPLSAKFILTTDADTLISKKWITKHWQLLQQPDTVFTYGSIRFLPDANLTLKQSIALFVYTIAAEVMHTAKNKAGIWIAGGANSGYKKEAALRAGGYDVSLAKGEDTDLMTRIAQYGRVIKVKNATVYTSARRIIGKGVILHAMQRLQSNIKHCLTNEVPTDTEYTDYRLI